MKALTLLLTSLVLACACSHIAGGGAASVQPRYELNVVDNMQAKRFDLALVSEDGRAICLPISQWPSKTGWLDSGSHRAQLIAGSAKLPAQDRTFGYSAGVLHVLAPGAVLQGYIPYSEFGEEEEIAKLGDRRLAFSVAPRVCIESELDQRGGGN